MIESDGRPQIEQEAQLRNSPQRWWLMGLLVSGMVLCYAQRGALSVAAPLMMKEFNLSPAVMGMLLSAFFWTYAFMQVPTGWLVDRVGVRRSYALGFIVWSISFCLTGFARNFIPLVAVRMLMGIGQAVAFPASARAVAYSFQEKERGTVTASYLIGVRLGQALVGYLATYFLALYGWKWFFLIGGIVPLLWLVPWHQFHKKWGDKPAVSRFSEPPGTLKTGPSFVESLFLLKHRSVLGIFLGFFAYDYAWYVYVNWLPGYLVMERGFSLKEMGIYSSVPYVAMSVVILLSGLLSDWFIRFGYGETRVRRSLLVSGMLIACLIVPAGIVKDRMTAVWLLTIALCGLGIASPNTWTLTQAVCSKRIVGTVSGIQNFGGNLGGILAPALTGYIAHVTGSFALALGLTGAMLGIGLFSYGLLISRRVDMEF